MCSISLVGPFLVDLLSKVWNHPNLSAHIDATSGEFNPEAAHPIIIFMPEISTTHMGGTMRLGLRPTVFEESSASWSVARRLYGGKGKIWERHRHRYEVNPEYVERLVASGMSFVGKDEKGERMQVFELKGILYHCFSFSFFSHTMFLFRTSIFPGSSGTS